jgi:uncharacterized lipoprotein YajG
MSLKLAAILVACALLAGCASKYQEAPQGIGSGPNALKQSPCACTTLPNPGRPVDLAS